MLFHSRSALLRTAAVATAAASSLVAASSASAAMDNARAVSLANLPNLTSVTAAAPTTSGTDLTFVFDRPVDLGNASQFSAGDYGQHSATVTSVTTTSNPAAIRLRLAPGTDPSELTYATAGDGAVNERGNSARPNIADSSRIAGSSSESGTRGHTVAPDLVSATRNTSDNTITYTFDEALLPSADANPSTGFYFVGADGTEQPGTGPTTVNANTVTVFFGSPNQDNTNLVSRARQAIIAENAATDAQGNRSPEANVAIAGASSSSTANPALVSAELSGTNRIVYTFDQTLGSQAPNATSFHAVFADLGGGNGSARQQDGTSVVVSGATATVTFGAQNGVTSLSDKYENVVAATADSGAVSDQNSNASIRGGKPVGGNAGAKANGYTSAPDGINASFSGNDVFVTFDSRLVESSASDRNLYHLIDNDGFAGDPTSATPAINGAPGPTTVDVQFANTGVVTDARGIKIDGGSIGNLENDSSDAVDQQIGK